MWFSSNIALLNFQNVYKVTTHKKRLLWIAVLSQVVAQRILLGDFFVAFFPLIYYFVYANRCYVRPIYQQKKHTNHIRTLFENEIGQQVNWLTDWSTSSIRFLLIDMHWTQQLKQVKCFRIEVKQQQQEICIFLSLKQTKTEWTKKIN